MKDVSRSGVTARWLPILVTLYIAGVTVSELVGRADLVPPCLFRATTGYLCPGCGSGRLLGALLRLDFGSALRMNPLVFVAAPFVAYALLREGLSAWGIAELPWPRLDARWGWVLLGVVLAYWVLRNVPAWPLTLLAPL